MLENRRGSLQVPIVFFSTSELSKKPASPKKVPEIESNFYIPNSISASVKVLIGKFLFDFGILH